MDELREYKLLDSILNILKERKTITDYKASLPIELGITLKELESLLKTLIKDGHVVRGGSNPNILQYVFNSTKGYLIEHLSEINKEEISAEILRLTIENLRLQNNQIK